MSILKTCYNCSGDGLVLEDGGEGSPPGGTTCPVCQGVGKLAWGEVEGIDELAETLDDILDKLNDLKEKVDEIKEVVDGL